MTKRPLILITNDDGITSPGLLAAAQAVAPLGDLLIVAPHGQQTGAGRSFRYMDDRKIYRHTFSIDGKALTAYSLKGTPAQATLAARIDLASRPIDLVISGINFGENIGSGITISGTVGAALEAAAADIPALAVSLQTPVEHHTSNSTTIDFSVAAYFTHLFAQSALNNLPFPPDVDVLKIDIPDDATRQTPWRITQVSRQAYHFARPAPPERRGYEVESGYFKQVNQDNLEPDSDIWAMCIDRLVSVTPLSLNLTSRVSLETLAHHLKKGT